MVAAGGPALKAGDPATDAERRSALRRMKMVATGFLVVAGVIYLVAEYALHNGAPSWVGYFRAAAEAGMVGGLADWFAVTALFRHPLGLPIPHTALIPRRKDELGRGLEEFFGENFLQEDIIRELVGSATISLRVGHWLTDPEHVRRLVDEHTSGRTWGVLGEPRVNVLMLNLAVRAAG